VLVGVSRHGERRQRMTTRHVGEVCESRCGERVSVIEDVKMTLDNRRAVEKSRFVIVPMAGRRDTRTTHHEEIDQIKIKERKGSFSKRVPSERKCVISLGREW
jgi:tRNA G37 N-methylase Trm5